jgi:tetratricopeptide (TPR) repeat protein
VRRASSGALGVANHFLDSSFQGDASNNWLKRYLTSEARYQRLMQLLKRFSGRLDVRTAALILRNRTGLDDEPLGLGNRNAIDALIATHGVVVDLTDMVLWVSRGPHLLGPFAAVDLKPIFSMPLGSMDPPEPIPADILLDSPELKRHQMSQQAIRLARELGAAGQLTRALDYAHRASLLSPDSHEAQKLMGDLLWEAERKEEAKDYYRSFLKLRPPYLKEKEGVIARLNR